MSEELKKLFPDEGLRFIMDLGFLALFGGVAGFMKWVERIGKTKSEKRFIEIHYLFDSVLH